MKSLIKRSFLFGIVVTLGALSSQAVMAQTTLEMTTTVDNIMLTMLSQDDAVPGVVVSGPGAVWEQTDTSIPNLVGPVTHYIHVVGENLGGPAMFLGEFTIGDKKFKFENGTQSLLTGDPGWMAGVTDFTTPRTVPVDLGPNDGTSSDWSAGYGGTPPDLTTIDATARFIWHELGPDAPVATFSAAIIPAVADIGIVATKNSSVPVVAGLLPAPQIDYDFVITNTGTDEATNVVIQLTELSDIAAPGFTCNYSIAVDGAQQFTIASLPVGPGDAVTQSVTCTVPAGADAGDTYEMTVSVDSLDQFDLNAGNDSDVLDDLIVRESDLSITKVGDVDPVTAGNELTYTIDVSNAGPSVADDVVITDTLPAGTNLVSSTGCDESPAGGVPTCTVGTIADGASAQVTLTVLVDNAVAAGATLTNAVTVESASTDPTPGDNAASEATAVIRVAVWEVTKVWEDGGPVDVQLDCSDSLTPVDTAMTGGAQNSATLTHTAFADGVDCVVTETVPLGQAPTYVGDCDVTDIVSGGDAYTCMITNNTSEARILVTKWFSDDSESEVSVTVECNDGFISQDGTATVMGGDPAGHTFIITDFIDGALDCTVTESGGPSGYVSSPVLGYEFLGMDSDPGFYEARFDNAAMPATYTVTKEWMITNDGGDEVQKEVYVTIECESSIMPEKPIAAKELAECLNGCNYTKSGWLGDGDMLTAVVSTYSGPAMCKAYEGDVQSGVDVENGCEDYKTLTAGESYGCTIYNSVFFEGIPTLSQYGLALMALLMLGVGFIGFRRFI